MKTKTDLSNAAETQGKLVTTKHTHTEGEKKREGEGGEEGGR